MSFHFKFEFFNPKKSCISFRLQALCNGAAVVKLFSNALILVGEHNTALKALQCSVLFILLTLFTLYISIAQTKLLGVKENATTDEIDRAFRVRALKVHPDKNPEDKVRATKQFQLLTEAKIVLLDPEKRRNLDESLIDSGVRNWKALPLLCSICTNAKSRVGSRCLKGMGHINPLIEEFNSASKEYEDRMQVKSKKSGRHEFLIALEGELNKFIANNWERLYPLTANRKQTRCSKEGAFLAPTDLGTSYSASGIHKEKPSVPSAADIVGILKVSLVRESEGSVPVHPPVTDIPIYDLSCLSSGELEQILQYFGLLSRKPFSRDLVIEELSLFIPKCAIKSRTSNGYQERSGHVCQQCGRRKSGLLDLFFSSTFTTCFICGNVCCQDCLSSTQQKIPTSGSYDLRSLCKPCMTTCTSSSREAATWLAHGEYLFARGPKYSEAALAMYRLSNELFPMEIAIIRQAQLLFSCEKYEQLVHLGKDVLRTATLEGESTQELQKLVAKSLMKIAHDADDSELLRKADRYEEVIQWTAQCTDESGGTFHDLKVEAMRRRLHCHEIHERVTKQRVKMLFLHLITAIREGSLLKMVALLQDMDEEAKDACLKQLSTESPATYSQYGKLLLRLAKTMMSSKQDPTEAFSQIADIFWSGYSLFLENGCREHIFNVVIHFTCQLLQGGNSLTLETLREITPTNFLHCLHLTEDDLISPPDIEDRWWKNVVVEGCDMKMFLKYELAVKKLSNTRNWSPVKVALSYYDLTSACSHPCQLLVTLITSAQWFAKQLSLPNSDSALQYSCKKMVVKLTNLAAAMTFEFGTHPHQQYYVARMVLGLQFYASTKAPLASQDDAETIGEHLNWLVASGRLCPLHKIPIVSPTESVILHIISQDLYSEYLLKLQDELPPHMRPVSEAILRYHIYENHWRKRCQLQDPTGQGLRLTAMTELLHAMDWSWVGVQQLLHQNMVPLDSEGWLVRKHQLLEPVASSGVHRLVGLEISKEDYSIQLLIRKHSRRSPSLLCWEDIAIGLTMDPGCFFSLEAVTPKETLYHPFNEQKFMPEKLQASRFLNTLFHTDYLLKQFSTGFEISSYPPFHKRPVHEGLLKGLPKTLQKALLPIPSRGRSLSRAHRLWIQADTMEYDVQENDNSIRWLFGDVHMTVRCKPIFHTQDGELQDQDIPGPDPDSPEGTFIADFNKHYDQIGKHFPEFLRLKELCKVQRLGGFISGLEKNLEKHSRRLESEEMYAKYGEMYESALQEAQDHILKQLDDLLLKIKRQVGWFVSDNLIRQIHQEVGISAPYHEIYNWVRYGDTSVIAKRMAREQVGSVEQIKRTIIEKHAEKLRLYRRTVSTLKKNCKKCLPSSKANGCRWVPAVCHCEDGKSIYGGVLLTPRDRKVTLQTGRDISRVPLTPNFFGFHETVKQPPVKPFNPPRTNGRKVPLTNSVSKGAAGPPSGSSGGGPSPSGSDDDDDNCGSASTCSGKGGTCFELNNRLLLETTSLLKAMRTLRDQKY